MHSCRALNVHGMRRSKHLQTMYWLLPLALQSADANAWGLMTHLYFAHSLLWAMPLLDPRLQNAIKNFPELVMAGACLPDLAIVAPEFRHTHQWENAHRLMSSAKNEEQLAIAIGYASHLYVDVIAHNHFVPAHEAMWMENTLCTHIASEWAMDAHLAPLVDTSPGKLLTRHRTVLSEFISPYFRCSVSRTNKGLQSLAFWDNVLRRFRIPHLIYGTARLLDKRIFKHFVYYIAKTQTAIAHIGIVLEGREPNWEPELNHLSITELASWRRECLNHLDLQHPAPINYFTQV